MQMPVLSSQCSQVYIIGLHDQSASGCIKVVRLRPMSGLTIQYGCHVCNQNIVPQICVEGVSDEDFGVVSA
jgi:hypothetical protein